MNPIYFDYLNTEIKDCFENLSDKDVKDFEFGKPLHINYWWKGEVIRVIIFMEKR
jgi:hypothetical protein